MTTVLIIQLVVPLVLGIPALIVSEWLPYRRSRSDSSVGGSAYGATQLKPLQCPHCSAPVPLQRQPAPCPSCGETVTPPPEYVHMLDSRAQAIAELARAERWWRWSRWTSSPLVGLVVALASVAWLVVVVWAMIVTGWSMSANLVMGAARLGARHVRHRRAGRAALRVVRRVQLGRRLGIALAQQLNERSAVTSGRSRHYSA